MGTSFSPYLHFHGNAAEAMATYGAIFGGSRTSSPSASSATPIPPSPARSCTRRSAPARGC